MRNTENIGHIVFNAYAQVPSTRTTNVKTMKTYNRR